MKFLLCCCLAALFCVGMRMSLPIRGYGAAIKVKSYRNPKNKMHGGYQCDSTKYGSYVNCDVRISLNVTCPMCDVRSSIVVYPSPNEDYTDVTEKDFTTETKTIVVVFNESEHFKLSIRVKAEDIDISQPDLLVDGSDDVTIGQITQMKPLNIRFYIEQDEAYVQVEIAVMCAPMTCGKQCYWPSESTVCEWHQLVCTGSVVLKQCNKIRGNFVFTFRLHYISLSAAVLAKIPSLADELVREEEQEQEQEQEQEEEEEEGERACQPKLKACVTEYNGECKQNHWQTLSTMQNFTTLNDSIVTDEFTLFDYYRDSTMIDSTDTLQLSLAIECGKYNTLLVKVQEGKNLTKVHWVKYSSVNANLSASFGLKCNKNFRGVNCNKHSNNNKPDFDHVFPQVCGNWITRGPTCAHRHLCTQETCDNEAKCGVQRLSSVTAAGKIKAESYKHLCVCPAGYEGERCEGTTNMQAQCTTRTCFREEYCNKRESNNMNNAICKCPPGLEGRRCEVCTHKSPTLWNLTQSSTSKASEWCASFRGAFALVIEVTSFTNDRGKLSNGSFCDSGESQCDTVVFVTANKILVKVAAARDRDNLSSLVVSHDEYHQTFEMNFSHLQQSFSLPVSFVVLDGDKDNMDLSLLKNSSSVSLIAIIAYEVKFSIDGRFPRQLKSSLRSGSIAINVTVTLRCARGFWGAMCNKICGENAPYSLTTSSELCWPHADLLCANGLVGVSCLRDRVCAASNCSSAPCNTLQFDTDSVEPPKCAFREEDACARQVCMKRGDCIVGLNDTATCKCQTSFHGKRCEIDNWNPCKPERCNSVTQCHFYASRKSYKCFCNYIRPGYSRSMIDLCDSEDPCELITCENGGQCSLDTVSGQTKCLCTTEFVGTYCNESVGFFKQNAGKIALGLVFITASAVGVNAAIWFFKVYLTKRRHKASLRQSALSSNSRLQNLQPKNVYSGWKQESHDLPHEERNSWN